MNNPDDASRPWQRIRFGPFQVDFETGEVRKHGLRIRLQEKPLRVLQALVEKPGQLVPREELHGKLWPKDLYVDFERNLTIAMNKLRTALSDSAENPRYIETLPRRGYRFFAPVEEISPKTVAAPPQEESVAAYGPEGGGVPGVVTTEGISARTAWVGKRLGLAMGAAALLITAAILLRVRLRPVSSEAPSQAAQGPVRLAVLPFVNLTGDEQREYLCDGLMEEMIAELSRLNPGELDVIARTSAMQYKGTTKSVPEIGRELNVSYVLDSSVREFGDRVRVTTQLVRASDAGHVWTGEYDRDVKDVLVMQQQIATAIAGEINLTLVPRAGARQRNANAVNPEAYRKFLLGRYQWNRRTTAGFEKSIVYLREALREDPNFALVYAALADSLLTRGDPESVAEAKAAARRAIELNPSLGEPHASLAFMAMALDWDWAIAEREFRRAVELSPNYPTAHHWYAIYFENIGRPQEALRELNRGVQLDPLSPVIRAKLAMVLSATGPQDRALEEMQKALEIDPAFVVGYEFRAVIYERKRMFAKALQDIHKARELGLEDLDFLLSVAYARAVAGDRAGAEKTIREIFRLAERAGQPRPAGDLAAIYLALGDRERALECLETARQRRGPVMLTLKADPDFAALRSEPRFQALVRSMNFPP